jgi:predicted nucleotidyltransferase
MVDLSKPEVVQSIADFCRRHGVSELSVFGSLVRGGFRDGGVDPSDVDVLIRLRPDSAVSTWDWPRLTDELEAVFGKRVDLVTDGALENPYRRRSILANRRVLYAGE